MDIIGCIRSELNSSKISRIGNILLATALEGTNDCLCKWSLFINDVDFIAQEMEDSPRQFGYRGEAVV